MKWLIAFGLAITLGFSSICAIVLWQSRSRDYEQARQSAFNMISTISSDIARNFELYDLSLQAVVDGMKLPELSLLSPKIRQLVLFDRAATAKDMGSIFVLDKTGTVISDSRTETPRADNYAQSDFFQVHQQNASAGAYISKPWVTNSGEYLIAISRRLSNVGGTFSGVVVGTLRLSYFHDIFRRLKFGEHDAIAIIREGGSLVMRAPFDIDVINRYIGGSTVFHKITGPAVGSYQAVAGVDGIEKLFVHQRIGELPLYIGYGQSIDAIYANWRQDAWWIGLLMLALCAINVALIVLLSRSLKNHINTEHKLAIMATTDVLTGLRNRRRFDEVLEQEWRRAQRSQKPIAVLMIDADKFKEYNDQFGHQAGDDALKVIAHYIAASARRASDLSARYGGEEFAVLLPETTIEQALLVAERIRSNILMLCAKQQGSPDSIPTVSIGVAAMVPCVGHEPLDLIRATDNALYEAKAAGRNRSVAATIRLVDKDKLAA
jgi:diguanylate cyclase (GGDEF)-like protein